MRTGRLTRTYLGGGSRQKVVNLPVDVDSTGQILDTANLSLDKVVAVDGSGDSSGVHTRRHELEDNYRDFSKLDAEELDLVFAIASQVKEKQDTKQIVSDIRQELDEHLSSVIQKQCKG